MTIDLSQAKPGDHLTVLSIDPTHADINERLSALGIFPGAALHLLRKAPLGDPLQVKAGHTLISIRRQEAQAISVVSSTVDTSVADNRVQN
jgi:ferrous iron transport protein A